MNNSGSMNVLENVWSKNLEKILKKFDEMEDDDDG